MPNYEDRQLYSDALVYRAAEEFIRKGLATGVVADRLMKEFGPPKCITRESIYPLLTEAIRREFVRLVPPLNLRLAEELEKRFPGVVAAKWTRVVEPSAQEDDDKVSEVAAQLVLETLEEVKVGHDPSRPIGLGLGPGRATLDFCRHLSRLIRHNPEVPDSMLVAIAAGGSPFVPEYSPTSFFNLFPRELFSRGKYAKEIPRQIGLFAESLVPAKDLEGPNGLKTRVGVREAFAAKNSIDVVVTAMGDMDDKDDLLANFLRDSGQNLDALRKEGWVGNVQYRPYSATGPIKEKNVPRVLTLFELDELADMSRQESKRVVLIARRCGRCGRTRAQALRPLLTQPKLKVFSRLVLDAATAADLLKD